ncbi:hypothetical protein NC653_039644 [Populus alba x Populus x berolinensis]|uniref:Uncharacterized protein n=1 Tax=Populus alba x Populus x berolinensis TaxID=444605 RepID=A0AAD6LBQ0_9ROSI|nr:hypothetical protein NC653_039644 [Populus alba x Populus x berolinensis]
MAKTRKTLLPKMPSWKKFALEE